MSTKEVRVPETLLKKRKRDEEWEAKRTATTDASKKKAKAGRKDIFKRAEQYVREYRAQVRSCVLASLLVINWTSHLVLGLHACSRAYKGLVLSLSSALIHLTLQNGLKGWPLVLYGICLRMLDLKLKVIRA